MNRPTLTGSRIRERRSMRGLRQAELARRAGISASYLNLIEHNRRRIGGKLLLDIAAALEVEPSVLSEGAEAALISTLREAAADRPARQRGQPEPELDRLDELAGRFPGWAALLADQHGALAGLERTVEALTDRLAHDPHLAASLHEVLSTVTAIRATASILVETRDLEADWRDRFHRNISEDSRRLAEGAHRLVGELDAGETQAIAAKSPQEEVEALLAARGFHLPELEAGGGGTVATVLAAAGDLSETARRLARDALDRYAADAAGLPPGPVLAAIREVGIDPAALAARFGTDPARMMRRLATLPSEPSDPEVTARTHEAGPARPSAEGRIGAVGLVICDASGTLTYRRPLVDFPLPRFGAACPLWPLFQALSRPMQPIRSRIAVAGRSEGAFTTHAVAQPVGALTPDRPPLFEAHMLILPDADAGARPHGDPEPVGVTCRICPREACRARREPSITGQGGG